MVFHKRKPQKRKISRFSKYIITTVKMNYEKFILLAYRSQYEY